MRNYLDDIGLTYLWSKIKATFVSKDDDVVYMAEDDGEGGAAEGGDSLPANIIAEEDGLYQIKGVDVYPVSHPDISTQPSVLPQRFGKEKIYEVLIPHFYQNLITNIEGSLTDYSRKHIDFSKMVSEDDIIKHLICVSDTGNKYYVGYYEGSSRTFGLSITGDSSYSPEWKIYVAVSGTYIVLEDTTSGRGPRFSSITWNSYVDPFITDIIPSDATVIEASSFNSEACVSPIVTKQKDGKWSIRNNEGVIPDFTLVRYIGDMKDYYYENNNSSSDPSPTIIKSFDIPNGATTSEWPNQMNVSEIWGNESLQFKTGQIIGKVIVNSNDKYDLVVVQDGSSIAVGAPSVNDTSLLLFVLNRTGESPPDVITAPPYNIHIDFYAL